jgi:hypothetical protein
VLLAIVALVVGLAGGAAAEPSADDKRVIGVLPTLATDGSIIGLMSVEGAASAAAVDAAVTRGVTCVTPANLRLLVEERAANSATCLPTDATCFAEIGERAGLQHLITLVLDPREEGVFLEIGLIDVRAARFVRKDKRMLPDTPDDIPAAVEQQVALILNSWRPDVAKAAPPPAPAPVPSALPAPAPTPVVVTPAGTGFVDGLGLLSAALTWGGVVVGTAGGLAFVAAMATTGGALSAYYFGGGYVPAKSRASFYEVGIYAAWVVPVAAAITIVGVGAASAGLLFFEGPEEGTPAGGEPAS